MSHQRESSSGGSSPPTERVVAVVELLLAAEGPLRVSDVASTLQISRSTCFSILETLEQRSWVQRRADRTYEPGRGLIPLANAVRARLPILGRADGVMRTLNDQLGLEGLTLSLVGGDRLSQVARVGPRTGMEFGPLFRVPMHPPFGAAVVAFARPEEQRSWLAEVPDAEAREVLAGVLESVRVHGVAVWRLDAVTELLSEAIFASQTLIDRITAPRRAAPESRAGLLALFDRLGLSVPDLAGPGPFAVAYLEAPIFDDEGRSCYVLEVHVLRESLPRPDLVEIVVAARAAADALTRECGGRIGTFQPL